MEKLEGLIKRMEFGETQARSDNYFRIISTPDAAVSKNALLIKAREERLKI